MSQDTNMIGEIRIPKSWFKYIKYPSGKVNLNAVMILAEIVHIGKTENVAQMQQSYQHLANQFGLTKRQVQDAMKFLREKGLIRTELRTVVTPEGLKIGNVLFVEPVFEKIKCITEETKGDV